MKINQQNFKYKYIKYKNKYLHLKKMNYNYKQQGGEILSVIKKKIYKVFLFGF